MAEARTPRRFRAAGATEAIRIAALGVNLWVVALALPMLYGGARGALELALAALPLLPLAAGALAIAANGRRGRRDHAIGVLLLAFPLTLAIVLASRADLADRDAWGALGLFVTAISLLAYGAVAAEACSRPLGLRASTAQALPSALTSGDPPSRTWLRRAVIAATASGGLLVAVVAPALGGRAALLRSWGDAADEATVLASIVGAAASAFALGALVGPRLRALRPGEAPPRGGLRIAVALLVAVGALALYLVLRRLEAQGA